MVRARRFALSQSYPYNASIYTLKTGKHRGGLHAITFGVPSWEIRFTFLACSERQINGQVDLVAGPSVAWGTTFCVISGNILQGVQTIR
ncbi:MAG: hypothetical protein DMG73_08395 [Acidobacteria bacterium]|nr:MAG: hypothetical protein DMG73_08395 [Acidobacteriota bacterium]PYX66074.1 MAG: hypothetical protein DMG74_05855 [Acidobacteriota bacterium]